VPVEFRCDPYRVHGYLHAPPTVNALAQLRRRPSFVPLTDAYLEYPADLGPRRVRAATLIVNRQHMQAAHPTTDEETPFPDLDIPSAKGTRAKDFTEFMPG
jgi:hypothetical protein